jgi:hypothetical protein
MDKKTNTASFWNKHLKEHLLCEDCEQRFSGWENHLSRILVQENGSFPWLEEVHRVRQMGAAAIPSLVDAEAVVRFAYSVFWRGSVCAELMPRLGQYERTVAEYLLGKGPLPKRASLIVELIEHPKLQRTIVPPQWERRGTHRMHWFVGCGAHFVLFVGGSVPQHLHDVCFARTGTVFTTDGADLLKVLAPSIMGTASKGALAKRDAQMNLHRWRPGR